PPRPALGGNEVAPDLVRAVAIALVVVIHTAGAVANEGPAQGVAAWWAANVYDSLARPGVPLFVMLSGWLLLAPERRSEPLSRFFRRRGQRVVLPLVCWSLIAYAWIGVRDGHAVLWTGFWRALVNGPVFYHLWFLYLLLGLYLVIPLLRPLVAEAGPPLRRYALGLWFIGSSVLPLWTWWGGPNVGVPVLVVSSYVGYLLAGAWLGAVPIGSRAGRELGILLILTGLWTMSATARLTGTEQTNVVLYGYDRPNVLVMSVAAFVLLTQPRPAAWVARHPRLHRVVGAIATTSLGTYLAHALILDALASRRLGIHVTGASLPPAIGIPLLAAAVLAGSVVLMLGVRRVWGLGTLLGAGTPERPGHSRFNRLDHGETTIPAA
ncbi:MAG TPA: acyltransferase family protein, partial [Gemmatimonadales bacterium]|nr:acyltransferase family protein [Gemmatimonadales bacterium]